VFKKKWVLVWVELRMNGERENSLPVFMKKESKRRRKWKLRK